MREYASVRLHRAVPSHQGATFIFAGGELLKRMKGRAVYAVDRAPGRSPASGDSGSYGPILSLSIIAATLDMMTFRLSRHETD
jgi:hypothetical protein